MKRCRASRLSRLLFCLVALITAQAQPAQPDATQDTITITRMVQGGGGTRSQAGVWSIQGTVGQVATITQDNGVLRVRGGFWAAIITVEITDRLFASGFE
jgi:hypothetical protein